MFVQWLCTAWRASSAACARCSSIPAQTSMNCKAAFGVYCGTESGARPFAQQHSSGRKPPRHALKSTDASAALPDLDLLCRKVPAALVKNGKVRKTQNTRTATTEMKTSPTPNKKLQTRGRNLAAKKKPRSLSQSRTTTRVHPILRMFKLAKSVETATGTHVVWPEGMKESIWASTPGFKTRRDRANPTDELEMELSDVVQRRWAAVPDLEDFLSMTVPVRIIGSRDQVQVAQMELQRIASRCTSRTMVYPQGALAQTQFTEVEQRAGVTIVRKIPKRTNRNGTIREAIAIKGATLGVLYAERMLKLAETAYTLHQWKRGKSKHGTPKDRLIWDASRFAVKKDYEGFLGVVARAKELGLFHADLYDMHMYFLSHENVISQVGAAEVVQRLWNIRDEMAAVNVPWKERNYTLAIRGLTKASEYDAALGVLAEMPPNLSPQWRTVVPLITALCQRTVNEIREPTSMKYFENALSLYTDMVSRWDLELCPEAESALFVALKAFERTTWATELDDCGDGLLQWYHDRGQSLLGNNYTAAVSWLEGRRGWTCSPTEIEDSGRCVSCHHQLDTLELEENEKQLLSATLNRVLQKAVIPSHDSADNLLSLYSKTNLKRDSSVTAASVRSELLRFEKWLCNRGPVAVVVDALNVGYSQFAPIGARDAYSATSEFSPLKLEAAMSALSSETVQAIAIARRHIKTNPDSRTRALVKDLEAREQLFLVPNGFPDDLFTIYAAIKNGMKVDLVANDHFRDIIAAFRYELDRRSLHVFTKWLRGHAKSFAFEIDTQDQGGLVTRWRFVPGANLVKKFDLVVQGSGSDRWHLRNADTDDWTCAVRDDTPLK